MRGYTVNLLLYKIYQDFASLKLTRSMGSCLSSNSDDPVQVIIRKPSNTQEHQSILEEYDSRRRSIGPTPDLNCSWCNLQTAVGFPPRSSKSNWRQFSKDSLLTCMSSDPEMFEISQLKALPSTPSSSSNKGMYVFIFCL